ncbi:hypothetical protein QP363_13425, partial [Corynebacterium sp. UMB6689]|nr:hypothetical protein [Corynebacterium sp. UMB6689]
MVNALSDFLEVTVYRDNKKYYQSFSQGGKPHKPKLTSHKSKQTGTSIHFHPDPKIFGATEFN